MLVYQNVKMRKSSLPQVCHRIHTLLAETKMDPSLRFAGCTDSFNHPQDPFIGLCWWLRWRRLCQYNVGSYPTLSTKSTSAVLRPLHTGWNFWGELFAWKKIFFKLLIECLHTEYEYHAAKKRHFHFSESSSNFSNFSTANKHKISPASSTTMMAVELCLSAPKAIWQTRRKIYQRQHMENYRWSVGLLAVFSEEASNCPSVLKCIGDQLRCKFSMRWDSPSLYPKALQYPV